MSTSSSACVLLVGDRVVLRAPSPPEAEYALFELGDIELRASEPGRVREHGYQTTAARARARLAHLGVTAAIARECGLAMQPTLAEAYARGAAARCVARCLGPIELLQSDTYDAGSKTYRGVFLDLATLARDLDLPSANVSATLRALHLGALLEAEPPDAPVILSTHAFTIGRKPGERTHKRPRLDDPRAVATALAELAARDPHPRIEDRLARADVLSFLRARSDAAPDREARELYQSLERTVTARAMPSRGPLSDPELWALESRIDAGHLEGVLVAIEELERAQGRTPGTTYIRARASLALHLEAPKLIAERVSALALSMTSFEELSLLAAEAWFAAGDTRRALPYARDLVDSPGIDEGLVVRARRVLDQADNASTEQERSKTYADGIAVPRPSRAPLSVPELHAPQSFAPAQSRVPTRRGAAPDEEELSPPSPPRSSTKPPPRQRPAVADVVLPSARPPPLDLELTPPPMPSGAPAASFTFDLPGPPRTPTAPPPTGPERRSEIPTSGRRGVVTLETRPPPGLDPRAEPESSPDLAAAPDSAALLPPFRTEHPAPLLSTAPLLPPFETTEDELAEHLALPKGIDGDAMPGPGLPRSVLEARIAFTMLARALGRSYRQTRQIELYANLRGIEAMQDVLLASAPDEADLRGHGALLSEILARRLDACWFDITPEDLGHWSMMIPPDTRVWPFGRLARLVATTHAPDAQEPGLVEWFRELESRSRLR